MPGPVPGIVFCYTYTMRKLDTWLRTHRLACVAYECVRWCKHKLFFWAEPSTPSWYGFGARPQDRQTDPCPVNSAWYHLARPLYLHEQVYYNLDNALRTNPAVKGFAFVFFMGIGDYLYTTPLWEALKQKYPSIPFYAYVGGQFDRNNSPIVGKLLAENPHFEKVAYFNGLRHPLIWKNYDYSAILNDVPEDFLVLPVYYEYGTHITHRVNSLFETFGLVPPAQLPRPKMYFPLEFPTAAAGYLERARAGAQGKKGIVFLQLDSRGSNYVYPHMQALVNGLTEKGYFVMSVTSGGPADNPNYLFINIKQLTINQTWQLLDTLKQEFALYVIAVNSVFWAASAGLNVPNLGLQHWIDKKVHNLWYPNIEVVTDYVYPLLPREKQIVAPAQSFTPHNRKIIDYKPEWVVRWFSQTFEKERV